MNATAIDEIIDRLGRLVADARQGGSRLGYFPALYLKVTLAVKKAIEEDFFEDGARMERLDVIFANRYLRAFEQHAAGQAPTRSWSLAFQAAGSRRPIVLQHLLLGINAHINLDLGIAAAETCPGISLPGLRADFERINSILAGMVEGVQQELSAVWPPMSLLDRLAGGKDEAVLNFSMRTARDWAWSVAERLAPLDGKARLEWIETVDRKTEFIGGRVLHPGPVLSAAALWIRLRERGSVAQIIEILS